MRRSGDIPAALTVLAVAMLLLGTRPSPAAGQADQAAAAARTPFYCAGNNGDSNDDYDSGNQNLWVHASTEAECTAGPRQALLAWSSLPLSTLACTPDSGSYVIVPGDFSHAHCTAAAAALNSKLGGSFGCDDNGGCADCYNDLVVNASECESNVAALNANILGVCDFFTTYCLTSA